MEQNKNSFIIEGANPSMVWCNIADYIKMLSKSMMKTYKQRQRNNEEITWDELDELNDKLRSDLDIIMCGNKNVQNENKTMNKKQIIRLNENQLRQIVKESVKRVLKEDYLDKSWNSVITDDGFWRHTPEQIHTYLLKRGYCVGMPKEEVMQLIEWARSMFFLPLDLPKRDKDDVVNIVMCKLKGDKFYNTFGGDRNEMDV